MGLISKEVEVNLSNNAKYYEKLGYKIPREKDKWGRKRIKQGRKLKEKVEDLPTYSNVLVEVKCNCCNKEYTTNYSNYIRQKHNDNKTYCNKCSSKIFIVGENNPSWNPNLTDKEREIKRHYPEYNEFVKKVMARDNYTCQCCKNKESGNIEVHHLDGYNWCVEKRTDETNGITLCNTCHKNFHSIYGHGNNTKEQFEEWLGHALRELERYNNELPTARKIYCIEENKIYDSSKQLADEWNLKTNVHIHNVCNHKQSSNGVYYKSVKGKHLLWYEEYKQCSEEDIQRYLEWCKPQNNSEKVNGKNNPRAKKVICITTGKVFDTIKEASEFYNICNTSIIECCKGRQQSAGELQNGTKLIWKYKN